jgi:hypothetical protein
MRQVVAYDLPPFTHLSLISLSTAPIKLSQHGRDSSTIGRVGESGSMLLIIDDERAAAARQRWQRSYQQRKDRADQPATIKTFPPTPSLANFILEAYWYKP